jgi:hypothetical protein
MLRLCTESSWVGGLRASLDTEASGKVLYPCWELNPRHPVHSQTLHLLSYTDFLGSMKWHSMDNHCPPIGEDQNVYQLHSTLTVSRNLLLWDGVQLHFATSVLGQNVSITFSQKIYDAGMRLILSFSVWEMGGVQSHINDQCTMKHMWNPLCKNLLLVVCVFNQSTPLQFYYHYMFRSLLDHLQVMFIYENYKNYTYNAYITCLWVSKQTWLKLHTSFYNLIKNIKNSIFFV